MTPRWICLAGLALPILLSVSARAETIRISIDNLIFSPSEVQAKVGDTVEWINNDVFAHTATATNRDWDVAIAPQKTARLTLTKPGAVDYFCKYHPNMKARLTVAP